MPTIRGWGAPALSGGLCALLLTACHSYPSAPPPTPLPAHLVAEKTSAQCIAQMQTAAQRPDGSRVVLTTAAFAHEDRLSIVQSDTILDAAGQPANGRMRGVPDSFRLTLNKGVCTMVREIDAQATALTACTCVVN